MRSTASLSAVWLQCSLTGRTALGFDDYDGDLLRSTTAQEGLARGGLSFMHEVSLLKPGFIGVSIEHFAGNVKLPRRSPEENTERIAATQCRFETCVNSLRIPISNRHRESMHVSDVACNVAPSTISTKFIRLGHCYQYPSPEDGLHQQGAYRPISQREPPRT